MKSVYYLSAKQMGFILIAISVGLFLVFLSATYEIMNAANVECQDFCGYKMK